MNISSINHCKYGCQLPFGVANQTSSNHRKPSPSPSLCRAVKQIDDLKLGEDVPLTIESIALGDEHTISLISADVDTIMEAYIAAGSEDKDPYWTCVWPSSVSMAYELFKRPELVKGKRVADLGCGLGLAGLAAAYAGKYNPCSLSLSLWFNTPLKLYTL